MRSLNLTILVLILSMLAKAQSTKRVLKPGDKVPDIRFATVVNQSTPTFRLCDFKGKLVILDFWATWCTSCLQSFPKMDSLQGKFDGKLKILLVNSKITGDDVTKVRAFFERWEKKYGKVLRLASAVNDVDAKKIFEHHLVPHYVWISSDGKYIGTTSASQVNAKNIKAIIDGEPVSLLWKKDQDTEKPLFSGPDLPTDKLLTYSMLIKGSFDGLPGGSRLRMKGQTIIGRTITNLRLIDIYKLVAQQFDHQFSEKQIIVETEDASGLDSIYSIDVILPEERSGELVQRMLEVLNTYSGYEGRFEKRRVKCLVLRRVRADSVYNIIEERNGDKPVRRVPGDSLYDNGEQRRRLVGETQKNYLWDDVKPGMSNGTMAMLVGRLNSLEFIKELVVDEAGYAETFDIEFGQGLRNVEGIRRELERCGLEIVEEEREVEVILIKRGS